jgi:pilus assembly protein Flp/PilA
MARFGARPGPAVVVRLVRFGASAIKSFRALNPFVVRESEVYRPGAILGVPGKIPVVSFARLVVVTYVFVDVAVNGNDGLDSRAGPGDKHPRTGERSMKSLTRGMVNFLKREDGPTAVEYAVMLALIIVVCIIAITALGSNASGTFNFVSQKVSTTSTSS